MIAFVKSRVLHLNSLVVRPFVCIASSIVLLAACTGCAHRSTLGDKTARIDALFTSFNRSDGPGASVMVIHDGAVVFKKGYGLASIDEPRPITTATNFRLASVTKQFTAMCVMMLAERGKLSYDDTLNKFFPDFPTYGRSITVRRLLHHTSGLLDYESLIPDSQTVQVLDRDVLDLLMRADSTYFVPGSKHQYSNTGYAFLALITEKVSGLPFAAFLKTNIFDPLGMRTTVAFENGISTVADRAFGYTPDGEVFQFTDQSVTSAVLGDGGIYSNVEDLYKWDQSLYNGKLVSRKTLDQAFSAGMLNDSSAIDYGFGWHLETYRGVRHPYHTGSTRGFRNAIVRFPDQKFTVIVLTNRNEDGPLEIAKKITDLLLFDNVDYSNE